MTDSSDMREAYRYFPSEADARDPSLVHKEVLLPDWHQVALVTGPHDVRLNEIRRLSGAKVHQLPRREGIRGVLFALVGTEDQVGWATHLIFAAAAGEEPTQAVGDSELPSSSSSSSCSNSELSSSSSSLKAEVEPMGLNAFTQRCLGRCGSQEEADLTIERLVRLGSNSSINRGWPFEWLL